MLTLFLLIGLSQEIKADGANGQFADTKTPNHIVTEADVKQVAYYIDRNEIVAGKWYTLNSGFTFKMEKPSLFKSEILRILSKVKKTTVTSIRDEFENIQILNWDDNISTKTRNYNIKNGKLGFSEDYSGGPGVRVVMYMGYPVLKVCTPCFNPNEPMIVVPPVKKDTVFVVEKQTIVREQETFVAREEECWETQVWYEPCWITESYDANQYYAGIGDFSGSPGNRMATTAGTRKVRSECRHERKVRCGTATPTTTTSSDPIASTGYEETGGTTVNNSRRNVNVGVSVNVGAVRFSRGSDGRVVQSDGFIPVTPPGQGNTTFIPVTPPGQSNTTFTPVTPPGNRGPH